MTQIPKKTFNIQLSLITNAKKSFINKIFNKLFMKTSRLLKILLIAIAFNIIPYIPFFDL